MLYIYSICVRGWSDDPELIEWLSLWARCIMAYGWQAGANAKYIEVAHAHGVCRFNNRRRGRAHPCQSEVHRAGRTP